MQTLASALSRQGRPRSLPLRHCPQIHVFEDEKPNPAFAVETDRKTVAETESDKTIRCAACGYTITDLDQRMMMNGLYYHTYLNPSNILYQIGCFAQAPGCMLVGDVTEAHSWFPGYAWKIALCASCTTHLGWQFTANDMQSFLGLILDRLVMP